MISIPINPIRQLSKQDCIPACGAMIAEFVKKPLDYSKFSEGFRRTENGGSTLFELANNLAKTLNAKVKVVFFNYYYFDDTFTNLNTDEQLKYLDQLGLADSYDADPIAHLRSCVESKDVRVEHRFFTIKELNRILEGGSPVVTSPSIKDFRQVKAKLWAGHSIVLNGFDEDVFHYVDPHWDDAKFGQRYKNKEQVYASVTRRKFPIILWVENA